MKKTISLILCAVMLCSLVALTGCVAPADAALKFGSAVYVGAPTAADATADKDGSGSIDITIAAVSVDADGKIVACALDTASNAVAFKADGKAVAAAEFKTKYEMGKDYNMVAYGGATKEWFEQADAFEGVVAGKTLDEVKALIADAGKGTDEVISAGCTIAISDFVNAIEKAYNAAAESTVTAADTLKVTAYTSQTNEDATADKDGKSALETYVFAAAVNAEGKVVTSTSDCVAIDFTFTAAGKSTLDTTKAVQSKRELGDNYGMVAYGNAAKEWYAQADAFDANCEGKTAAEIAGLMGNDGKGVEAVQTAGCTIYVNGLVKAAAKIG